MMSSERQRKEASKKNCTGNGKVFDFVKWVREVNCNQNQVCFLSGRSSSSSREEEEERKRKEGTARVQGCLSIFSFSLALLASVEQTLKQQRTTTAVICCRKRPLTCWDFSSLEAAKCRSSSIKCSYAYKMTEIVVCIFSQNPLYIK